MNNYRLSFLIILIIVNVLLLFSQYKKNQYIENLHYQILEQTVESSQFSVSKKILTNFKYPLNLVVLFPDNYCKAWQDIDMPYLRSLSYKYANAMLVIDTNLPYSI